MSWLYKPSARSCQFKSDDDDSALVFCSTLFIGQVRRPPLMPNNSLNRTHCGMRLKALHFILGL